MDQETLRSTVLSALAAIAPDVDASCIRPDQPLREELGLDSLDWLNLVAAIHDRLGLEIPEKDYARIATLDSLLAYLARKRRPAKARARRRVAAAPLGPPAAAVRVVNGVPVTVRPIRPEDAPMEADFVRHLSDEARYQRFMASLRELPKAKLRYLTEVDQVKHVALVAVVEREGREVEIGVARYIVYPEGAGCEFAIAVDDEWQGTGLGGVLMHDLIAVAKGRGLAWMEGIVLATNTRMLRFTRQLGFRAERDPGDPGTIRVVLELGG